MVRHTYKHKGDNKVWTCSAVTKTTVYLYRTKIGGKVLNRMESTADFAKEYRHVCC